MEEKGQGEGRLLVSIALGRLGRKTVGMLHQEVVGGGTEHGRRHTIAFVRQAPYRHPFSPVDLGSSGDAMDSTGTVTGWLFLLLLSLLLLLLLLASHHANRHLPYLRHMQRRQTS